ncbi:MAG: hypothetical protein GX811_12635 [Lentisphaerae bacterium]|nr:hypothetical protein [Lentisphaerota bacterium]
MSDMPAKNARYFKGDLTVINIADMIEALYNGLIVNKNAGMQLSGSYLTVDPKTGVKTVTTTAAELFAGSVVLDGRYKMIVYNEGSNNVYWGNSTITAQTGFPLLQGDSVVFTFNTTEDMPIYFRAEANTVVRVGELA